MTSSDQFENSQTTGQLMPEPSATAVRVRLVKLTASAPGIVRRFRQIGARRQYAIGTQCEYGMCLSPVMQPQSKLNHLPQVAGQFNRSLS